LTYEIQLGNSESKLLGCNNPDLINSISHKCSFSVQGAYFSKLYKEGKWDGRKRLFSSATHKFPTGLLGIVVKEIRNIGEGVNLIDTRVVPRKKFNMKFGFKHKLRPYQLDAVQESITSQRGIIRVGTGGGKTIISAKIIHEIGVKTLICVNTKEALYDTVNVMTECFPDTIVGVWGDGKKKLGEFITVSTMTSVAAAFKKKNMIFYDENYGCLFVDEVHHVGSATWFMATMKMDSFYKFGMTGTAFRTDGSTLFLRASSGKIISDVSTRWLIDKGFLVEPDIQFIETKLKNFDFPMPYEDVYTGGIIRNKNRNKAVISLVKKHMDQSKLIVFEKLEHGDSLFKAVKKIDPNAVLINGQTKKRDELKQKFSDGKIKTAVVSRIYNESADLPILEIVINAAGGKSGIQVLQRIGRSVRTNKGKQKSIIYDFYDSFNYKLEQHSEQRMSWIKKEKFKLKEVETIDNVI